MNMKNPVGEVITRAKGWGVGDYRIIGVVKDMVMESPYEKAVPTYYFVNGWANWIYIRIAPGAGAHEALTKIEAVFKNLVTTAPFEYAWVDQAYASKFAEEERIGTLAAFYSALAIFISCMGLFGLSAFVAEQRTKEIGIRKILGASVPSILAIFSKDSVKLVVISYAVAAPLVFFAARYWLSSFAFHISMGWAIFTLPPMLLLTISISTIAFVCLRAALANPTRALRHE